MILASTFFVVSVHTTKTSGWELYVVIGRDQNGYFTGEVPQLTAGNSQGGTIDALRANITEVIELCLEEGE